MWNLDLAFADAVATSSDPRLGAIRLAWWRERLEALDHETAAPAEPGLQAAAATLLPLGVTGKQLSLLEDAWLPLLEPFPWSDAQADGLSLRGRILFGLGGRLLGQPPSEAEWAGELWSLVDGEHHCSDAQSRAMLRARAASLLAADHAPMPEVLRPLTVLAALAGVDVVREGGGLRRLSAAVKHRLTGRFPR